ncbi:helix-hairpin-helix domain-containing protein [Algihabitans albus]|uniref:helix-hairpin-helix domain-containing protein n=1 Tax=Algihabitans albus TaxID=2164067 RepID=UPI000E5D88EE|nr:helix-hairpin-helix domain-containing protein [Algihabitans albus]
MRTLLSLIRPTLFAASVVFAATFPSFGQDADARLNPNTATATELADVDGLPEAVAQAIVEARPFERTAQFDAVVSSEVEGDQKPRIYEQLFLPVDLNAATAEEIALIPGMTSRMIHEFEEYRPYGDIEQFNREIGKYVDDAEVARLRSYVVLND